MLQITLSFHGFPKIKKKKIVILYIPVENNTPNKIPNTLIDTASSKLEAAINNVLIPFTSPYPKRLSRNRLGTNTAGLTADKVNLKIDK